MLSIRYLRALAASLAALVPLAAAQASAPAAWPAKPVTVVVGFPPGTSVDNVARLLAEQFSKRWQQPVIVENRVGASGTIGANSVARASADGYALLLSSSGPMTINPHMPPKPPYDPLKAFTPIGQAVMLPYMMVARPGFPADTLEELVVQAKANPGKYTYGTIGRGSTSHLIMSLVSDAAGIELTHVPYSGSAQVQADLIGGNIDLTFDTVVANMPMVKSGRLKAIAVSTSQRSSLMPDVPTVAERGYSGFSASAWLGFFAPAGTPDAVVGKVSATLNEALQDPGVVASLSALGLEVRASASPAAFRGMVESEYGRWGEVVKKIGVQLD